MLIALIHSDSKDGPLLTHNQQEKSCVITFLLLNLGYCEINLSQQSSQVNMMETFIDYNAIYSCFTRHIFKFL